MSSPNANFASASSEPSRQDASHSIVEVPNSNPSGSTCAVNIPVNHPFAQIEGCPALKHKLQVLEDAEKIHRARADWKENQSSKMQNEVYTLFGLYFVFQGVVLTALFTASAQPNLHTCGNWLFPFLLCLTASLATIAAVLKKLFNDRQLQEEVGQEKNAMAANEALARDIRRQGAKFNLDKEPEFKSTKSEKIRFCSLDFWISYAGAVTLVLVIFSVIILISCRYILCNRLRI